MAKVHFLDKNKLAPVYRPYHRVWSQTKVYEDIVDFIKRLLARRNRLEAIASRIKEEAETISKLTKKYQIRFINDNQDLVIFHSPRYSDESIPDRLKKVFNTIGGVPISDRVLSLYLCEDEGPLPPRAIIDSLKFPGLPTVFSYVKSLESASENLGKKVKGNTEQLNEPCLAKESSLTCLAKESILMDRPSIFVFHEDWEFPNIYIELPNYKREIDFIALSLKKGERLTTNLDNWKPPSYLEPAISAAEFMAVRSRYLVYFERRAENLYLEEQKYKKRMALNEKRKERRKELRRKKKIQTESQPTRKEKQIQAEPKSSTKRPSRKLAVNKS